MKKNEKQLYLQEDQDLINELESIGTLSVGQALEEQKKQVQVIQIKATLRGRKSFDDFDKTTNKFTLLLVSFAIIQIFIALFQFIFDATTSPKNWLGLITVILLAGIILLVIRSFNKIIK